MATDYDARRHPERDESASENSLGNLAIRKDEASSALADVDEGEINESIDLPGADLSGEELSVRVIPKQADEFTCSECFLVHHRSQLATMVDGRPVCRDCAA
ncbi:DUF4193 domain-containing protein [Rhodococcus sp. D2-41]|uniref:DUF4193 domain-containing protein n=1 Tax=Speluncibacter jeojiensis TaxID=2710754 RepID=A0A9X4M4U8_9ACTN|nr:DUF4193 domain-containing protein [Rhodococcus sp. D2-41]MDG3010653.1 DUF4193 domain-containing protein [Rhodococcus sp. D2-41]MDG3016832.1 DUF4193 domain-containing protein [Corynebacteriales bacterium D3-21]